MVTAFCLPPPVHEPTFSRERIDILSYTRLSLDFYNLRFCSFGDAGSLKYRVSLHFLLYSKAGIPTTWSVTVSQADHQRIHGADLKGRYCVEGPCQFASKPQRVYISAPRRECYVGKKALIHAAFCGVFSDMIPRPSRIKTLRFSGSTP